MQCVNLVKLMPFSAFAMAHKNTIKNALLSRRKFRTAALELPEQMNGSSSAMRFSLIGTT